MIWLVALSLLGLPGVAVGMQEPGPIGPEIEAKLGPASDPTVEHRLDAVNVKLVPGATIRAVAHTESHIHGRWYSVPVEPGETAHEALYRLAALPEVALVELDLTVRAEPTPQAELTDPVVVASTPNDPLYTYQWHFPAAEVPAAWDVTAGDGVLVAVVDSGVSQGGEDLDCHTFVDEFNALTDTAGPGAATDDCGHGTHVAGAIAQCTDNAIGVAGVAGDATLMPIKVLDAWGVGDFSDVAQGIDWARTHGADVINMSLGTESCTPSDMVSEALVAAASDGLVLVAAAGNSAAEWDYTGGISFPACHDDVIAVGATDFNDVRSPYSQWGDALDLTAPGGDLTADANGDGYGDGVLQETFSFGDPSDWGYFFHEGTSMASPHVAGAAALLRSVAPSATRIQVERALELAALDLGPPGWDVEYGDGLLQVDAALDVILDDEIPEWTGGVVVASSIGDIYATLSWSGASDNSAVTGYQVWVNGALTATPASSPIQLTGLTPDTTYTVVIEAADLMGNVSIDGPTTTFTTQAPIADVTAPWWPAGSKLSADRVREHSVDLSWDPAADNKYVSSYRVYRNGALSAETPATETTVDGLTEGTTYELRVEAGDVAGNWSTGGPTLTITTEDWTSPEFPPTASITASDVFEGEVTLGWTPATDAGGIAEYIVWVDYLHHVTPNTSLTVTGLWPGTSYFAYVEATDAAGNWTVGPTVWFTTAVDFLDTNGSIFERDIAWLSGAGITKGCNPPLNDRYCPDNHVTRGQMAAFLVRALGLTDAGGGNLFTDDDDSIFETDIDKLKTAGITLGCNPPLNDRYCPDGNVTRGQMAAFLVRALGYTDDGGGDLFTDDDDSVFETDIDKLKTAGVTLGCNPPDNDRYCPASYVTRAQMAAFLHRALGGP